MAMSPEQEDILMTLDQVSQAVEVLQGVVLRLRAQVTHQATHGDAQRPDAQRTGRPEAQALGSLPDPDWGDGDVLH